MGRATTTFIALMCAVQWLGCNDDDKFFAPEATAAGTGASAGSATTGAGGKTVIDAGVAGTGGQNAGGKAGANAGASAVSDEDAGWIPSKQVDRSGLTNVGTAGSLDYGNPGMWACRPDMEPNLCNSNLDATLIKSDGAREMVSHGRTENPEFDCFYVYPTVLLSGAPQMVDFSEAGIKIVSDPLLSQGARFSRICRMYAPLYRQVGLATTTSGVSLAEGANRELAVKDVRDAFDYYLKNFNRGRKFVLVGHSQGTAMLTATIKQDIDPDDKADARSKMISALLIGGAVLVPSGQKVGGSFKNIPLCTEPGQTGCTITYASFAADKPPSASARFGVTTEAGMEVGCTNPATLSGNTGKYLGSYFATALSNSSFNSDTQAPADLGTPFVLYRDLFKGECVSKNGASYLEITAEPTGVDDKRTPPWRISTLEDTGWGLHVRDYNMPIEDLIQAVQKQAATALAP